jgi:hypothetical protein
MFARVILFAAVAGCRSGPAMSSQAGEPVIPIAAALPTDSAVLARLASMHPCGPDLPPVRRGDDSPPANVRCTLLTTALEAISARRGAPEVFAGLSQFKLNDVHCALIRAEAYRNERTGEIALPRWTVELLSDQQPSLAVVISRSTGQAETFRVLEEFGFSAAQLCA